VFEHFAKWASTPFSATSAKSLKSQETRVARVAHAQNARATAEQQPKPLKTSRSLPPVAHVAHVAHENIEDRKASGGGWDAEDWQTYFDERAAIAEFDGGLSRAEAEALAFECCIGHWLTIVPPAIADDGNCPGCNQPLGEQAVPVLRAGGGHVWLHHGCIEKFTVRRRMEARRALTEMGIYCPLSWRNEDD
jgi:hypothetical protein